MLSKTERHYLETGLVLANGQPPQAAYERTINANINRKAEAAIADFALLSKHTKFAYLLTRLRSLGSTPGDSIGELDLESD